VDLLWLLVLLMLLIVIIVVAYVHRGVWESYAVVVARRSVNGGRDGQGWERRQEDGVCVGGKEWWHIFFVARVVA